MFGYSTKDVINELDHCMSIHDVIPYLTGAIGDQSSDVVNRLFTHYFDGEIKKRSIVSEYVSRELSLRIW